MNALRRMRERARDALLLLAALIVGVIDECDRRQRRGEYAP